MPEYTYDVAPDGQSVTLTRRDLPGIADERAFAVTVTYAEWVEIRDAMSLAQTTAKFHQDRKGGL